MWLNTSMSPNVPLTTVTPMNPDIGVACNGVACPVIITSLAPTIITPHILRRLFLPFHPHHPRSRRPLVSLLPSSPNLRSESHSQSCDGDRANVSGDLPGFSWSGAAPPLRFEHSSDCRAELCFRHHALLIESDDSVLID